MLKRFLIAIIFVVVFLFAWFFQATRPVTFTKTAPIDFEIKSGWGIDRIGQELSSAKLIRSRTAFKFTVIVLGVQNRIQAGFFRLTPNMGITDIAKSLTHASVRTVRVTLQEGLRRQEIALLLDKAFSVSDTKHFSVSEFLSQTDKKEGYLFPDTYDFDPQASTSSVVSKLESRFKEITTSLNIKSENLNNVVILASLLEREAANSDEMPTIAGVIENRLNAKWPLQIDATVQYALASSRCRKVDCDWWPQNLSKSDLQVKSPYNTYQNQGLPIAPISNPGKAALSAAASPATTANWFYLHDSKGQIHFAPTIEAHNQNVCTYLKKDCP